MEPARDHQVQDEPAVVIQADGDSLAQPAKATDGFAVDAVNRRDGCSEQKWIADAHLIEPLTENAPFECFNVNGDVRQFGH